MFKFREVFEELSLRVVFMDEHPIVRQILEFALSYKPDFFAPVRSHNHFVAQLKTELQGEFKVINEYLMTYPESAGGGIGKIDLFVSDGEYSVVMEYDTKLRLKYKSIMKMLLSDAQSCIGIYSGASYPLEFNVRLYFDNVRRIATVKKQLGLGDLGKRFYLLNMMTKRCKMINV